MKIEANDPIFANGVPGLIVTGGSMSTHGVRIDTVTMN